MQPSRRVSLTFDERVADLEHTEEWEAIFDPIDATLDTSEALVVDYDARDFTSEPPENAAYVIPDAPVDKVSFFKGAAAELKRQLTKSHTIDIERNGSLKLYSRPGETPEDFRLRCQEAAEQGADREVAKIRDRLERKQDRLEAALTKAQVRLEDLDLEARARQQDELVAGAGAVLDAVLGGRRSTRGIASKAGRLFGGASRRRSSTSRADRRRRAAEEKVTDAHEDLEELEQEILEEVAEIDAKWEKQVDDIDTIQVGLEADDVRVTEVAVVWLPKD